MKLFTLSAVVLSLAAMSQHTNAEVFVFTPPISHPGYISINPRIESKSISDSLKTACATNKLKLVTVTTALDNRFKSEVSCDIDLSKAKATGQNCPITRKGFTDMGAAPCGRTEVRATFGTDGTKRISVTVVYAFSGTDRVSSCLPFDPSSVSSKGGMAKRWNVDQTSKTYEFTCPK
ncbi:hypothetical protein BG015_003376 [Linnemannia schmuckeri]|uniref:AA1-like domain-containing protein n=1 Tax=Linnemannia schmuckeri TaxID=64567 RepID=A0A9P5VD91_9FUNG|nr:hypothetical protein BG015_003376 [Linnemannia schmuckeri]